MPSKFDNHLNQKILSCGGGSGFILKDLLYGKQDQQEVWMMVTLYCQSQLSFPYLNEYHPLSCFENGDESFFNSTNDIRPMANFPSQGLIARDPSPFLIHHS